HFFPVGRPTICTARWTGSYLYALFDQKTFKLVFKCIGSCVLFRVQIAHSGAHFFYLFSEI
ncbi:MAG: hypothetical protein WCH85_07750, partial [Methanomicrobiales archaeon]